MQAKPKNVYVVFHTFGVRIVKGATEPKLAGAYAILKNPELPKGVPPHLWKPLPNGKIEVITDKQQVKQLQEKVENMDWKSMKQKYVKPKWRHYLETVVIAAVVSGLIKWLM